MAMKQPNNRGRKKKKEKDLLEEMVMRKEIIV